MVGWCAGLLSPLVVLLLVATSFGQEPPVVAERPRVPERVDVPPAAISRERQHARNEFIAARDELTNLLVATLTSEELAKEVSELSRRIKLRNAEERLVEVTARLDEVERVGDGDSDEAHRLRGRRESISGEIELLRGPNAENQSDRTTQIAVQVIAGTFRTEMAEETSYLADVLDDNELRERARRLRRLVTLARIAGSLRSLREDRASQVVPAGATRDESPSTIDDEPPPLKVDESLGEQTDEPPQ